MATLNGLYGLAARTSTFDHYHAAAVYDGQLWFIGPISDGFAIYRTADGENITTVSELEVLYDHYDLAVIGPTIRILYADSGYLRHVAYSLADDEWSTPVSRAMPGLYGFSWASWPEVEAEKIHVQHAQSYTDAGDYVYYDCIEEQFVFVGQISAGAGGDPACCYFPATGKTHVAMRESVEWLQTYVGYWNSSYTNELSFLGPRRSYMTRRGDSDLHWYYWHVDGYLCQRVRSSTGWSSPATIWTQGYVEASSLGAMLDPDGIPYVAFGANDWFKVIRWNGSGWELVSEETFSDYSVLSICPIRYHDGPGVGFTFRIQKSGDYRLMLWAEELKLGYEVPTWSSIIMGGDA